MKDAADYSVEENDLSKYGLDEQSRTTETVTYTNNKKEKTVTLYFGKEDGNGNRYVMLSDSKIVYLVENEKCKNMLCLLYTSRGTLKELLKTVPEEAKEDYVSITLTDETDPYRPKEQLEKVFSHILEVRMDNSRTRQKLMKDAEVVRMASPLEIFGDFFQEMQGRALNAEEQQVMNKIAEEMEEE